MDVTFLGHSGFLIELDQVVLIFDWWKGELPPLPEKPLLVFASHSHPDHFNPDIFKLYDGKRSVQFFLGNDIKFSRRHKETWGLTPEIADQCHRMCGGKQAEPLPGVLVETLFSTDAGVAFVVTAEGKTIYHAGDLNWWEWDQCTELWRRSMAHDYKRFLEPLRGRTIDLAMVPLDPRLGKNEALGLSYFLELTDTRSVYPMHQWKDVAPTERFQAKYPQWASLIHQPKF